MIFHHRKTEKPALWITAYDSSWNNQDGPNLYRIRCAEDLPYTEDIAHLLEQINIVELVWRSQGRIGFYAYLRGFFMDDWCCAKGKGASKVELGKLAKEAHKAEKDFWFMFLPSGFPNGKLE